MVKVQGRHKKQSGGHGQFGDVWIEFSPWRDGSQEFEFEDAVVGAYQKVENTVVGAYQKVETGAVDGYKKVEKKFVNAFLEKADGPEQAQDSQADQSESPADGE